MKISDLLEREPFGEILERTLSSFLAQRTGREHRVHWYPEGRSRADSECEQIWLCNPSLNALFTRDSHPANLAYLRAQYSHSPVFWKRLPHFCAVALATEPRWAPRFTGPVLSIVPPIENGSRHLITGGNNRIRLFDIPARTVYVILKAGFDKRYIGCELAARSGGSTWPFPTVVDVAGDLTWFQETVLDGVPTNRLRLATQRKQAEAEAFRVLSRWHNRTRSDVRVEDYATRLAETARESAATGPAFSNADREWVTERALRSLDRIREMSVKAGASIEMSDGHGDFQAGNVLWDGRQSWIIDWEHSGRRQFLYDALVYALAGRSPAGSAARFAGFLACPRSFLGDSFESAWPEMRDATPARWQLILTVFLLEQLVWYIEENRNPLFRHPDRGLIDLCREFDRALQECST